MSRQFDPRVTLARPELAAAGLEGLVTAGRFEAPAALQVVATSTPLLGSPDPDAEWRDELIHGERFDVLESEGAYVWGQACRDGYVGYVLAGALGPRGAAPTHWVSAIRTYAFAKPSFKSRPVGPFSLNALVSIDGVDGAFVRSSAGLFFCAAHLAPIGLGYARDHAAVAERFLAAPYLWSGRTSLGLDCSGLVQQALYACGSACPRDADQQAQLGRAVDRGELARGDLVCWDGHVGLMLDKTRLIHATSHVMATTIEPVDAVIARSQATGRGAPTAFRRL